MEPKKILVFAYWNPIVRRLCRWHETAEVLESGEGRCIAGIGIFAGISGICP